MIDLEYYKNCTECDYKTYAKLMEYCKKNNIDAKTINKDLIEFFLNERKNTFEQIKQDCNFLILLMAMHNIKNKNQIIKVTDKCTYFKKQYSNDFSKLKLLHEKNKKVSYIVKNTGESKLNDIFDYIQKIYNINDMRLTVNVLTDIFMLYDATIYNKRYKEYEYSKLIKNEIKKPEFYIQMKELTSRIFERTNPNEIFDFEEHEISKTIIRIVTNKYKNSIVPKEERIYNKIETVDILYKSNKNNNEKQNSFQKTKKYL